MENVTKLKSGISMVYGKIRIANIGPNFNNTKMQAELRQTVTTIYPGIRSSDSLSDGLYSSAELGGQPKEFTQDRVTWVFVASNDTLEEIQARLDSVPMARLARIRSLKPILSDEQINAMRSNVSDMTIEKYQEKYSKTAPTEEHPDGQALLYKNEHFQYQVTKFHANPVEDLDLREKDLAEIQEARISMTDRAVVNFQNVED